MALKCPKCHSENPDDTIYCGKCATPLRSPADISITKTLVTPIDELSAGSTLAGRYKILEELGKGGMGRVYKAHDREINENIAIKLLKTEIARDEKIIERFRNELKVARSVSHKHVCRMYDIGKEDEKYFITMEYVPGKDLKNLIREKGKIAEADVLTIAKEICEGLAGAHELGIVHRDLKPQNIMMDEQGRAKIMDFGIARSVEAPGVTEAGMIIGTPDYISPEQAEGEKADHRSDIYSLGVILYEMVTGDVPFKGETALSIALKHKSQLPLDPRKLSPEISESLSRLILICMEKDRERRYQSAESLLNDLRNIEEGLPLGTKIRPRRATLVQTLIHKKLLVPAAAVVLAVIAAIAYAIFRNPEPALDPNRIVVAIFDNQTGNPAQDNIGIMAADLISSGLFRTGLVDPVPFMIVKKTYEEYKGEHPLSVLTLQTNAGTVISGNYYLQGSSLLFRAQVTDARKDQIIKDLDLVSGPVEEPTIPIESLRQQIMIALSQLFEPALKDWAGVMPMPTSYEAYKEYLEGLDSFNNGRQKEALDHFLKAIALDPSHIPSKLWAAQAYMNLRQYAEAENLVDEVEETRDKLLPYDRYTLDFTKSWTQGDLRGMYHAQLQTTQLAPIPAEQSALAIYALVLNRPQEAVDILERIDPGAPNVFQYGRSLPSAYHMLGKYRQELKAARRVKKVPPEDYFELWREARALAALGKIEEVNKLFDEGLTLLPEQRRVAAMLWTSHELRGHGYKKESFQLLNRALQWLESRPKEEAKRNRYNLAEVLYASERWEEAQAVYEDFYKDFSDWIPEGIVVLGRFGVIAARRGDREEALRISSMLENDKRPYLFGWRNGPRASIAALLGDKELAVRLLQEALSQGAIYQLNTGPGYYIHPNMDLESLHDYPPFKELIKPKG